MHPIIHFTYQGKKPWMPLESRLFDCLGLPPVIINLSLKTHMKKEYWLPGLVFLLASIPMVYFLQYTGWGGDYVLLLAMGSGALATSFVLPKLRKPTEGDFPAQSDINKNINKNKKK